MKPHVRYSVSKSITKGEDRTAVTSDGFWRPIGYKGDSKSGIDTDGVHFSYFAVFDGHGGKGAADDAAKSLLEKALLPVLDAAAEKDVPVDLGVWWKKHIPEALRRAFMDMHRQITESGEKSGCTASVAIVSGRLLTVANVGDSHSVIDTGSQVIRVTADHRVEDSKGEQMRIIEFGGKIARSAHSKEDGGAEMGPLRVWPGGLAISRTLGDVAAEPSGVIPEPDVCELELPAAGSRLIMASDGLWDANMTFKGAAQQVRGKAVAKAADDLKRAALKERGKSDDITIIVADLDMSPYQTGAPPSLKPGKQMGMGEPKMLPWWPLKSSKESTIPDSIAAVLPRNWKPEPPPPVPLEPRLHPGPTALQGVPAPPTPPLHSREEEDSDAPLSSEWAAVLSACDANGDLEDDAGWETQKPKKIRKERGSQEQGSVEGEKNETPLQIEDQSEDIRMGGKGRVGKDGESKGKEKGKGREKLGREGKELGVDGEEAKGKGKGKGREKGERKGRAGKGGQKGGKDVDAGERIEDAKGRKGGRGDKDEEGRGNDKGRDSRKGRKDRRVGDVPASGDSMELAAALDKGSVEPEGSVTLDHATGLPREISGAAESPAESTSLEPTAPAPPPAPEGKGSKGKKDRKGKGKGEGKGREAKKGGKGVDGRGAEGAESEGAPREGKDGKPNSREGKKGKRGKLNMSDGEGNAPSDVASKGLSGKHASGGSSTEVKGDGESRIGDIPQLPASIIPGNEGSSMSAPGALGAHASGSPMAHPMATYQGYPAPGLMGGEAQHNRQPQFQQQYPQLQQQQQEQRHQEFQQQQQQYLHYQQFLQQRYQQQQQQQQPHVQAGGAAPGMGPWAGQATLSAMQQHQMLAHQQYQMAHFHRMQTHQGMHNHQAIPHHAVPNERKDHASPATPMANKLVPGPGGVPQPVVMWWGNNGAPGVQGPPMPYHMHQSQPVLYQMQQQHVQQQAYDQHQMQQQAHVQAQAAPQQRTQAAQEKTPNV